MKKILIPTDFSSCANNAINFAVQSAKLYPASIILLHAFEANSDVYTDYVGLEKEFHHSLINDAEKKLEQVKESIEGTENVTVSTRISRGTVREAVMEIAIGEKPDLIVMGTFGASGIKEKLLGSKTASVIGYTDLPLISIPYDYEWKKPENILLATNQFEEDFNILNTVFELASLYTARIEVAVFTDTDDDNAAAYLEHSRQLPMFEKKLREKYREQQLIVSHLYGTDFEDTLQKYIKERSIDMLVMITYQKDDNVWTRLFNPSKTRQMSAHTSIPLLAIPGHKPV